MKLHHQELIEKITKYLEDNIGNPKINTRHVANHTHYQRTTISKLFTKHVGMTFYEYFALFKVEQAKKLLKANTVGETAKLMGYKTHDGFGAMFKRYTGMTPIEFKHLKPMSKHKYVIAPTHYAWYDFLRKHGLQRNEYRYLHPGDMNRVIGLRNNYIIVVDASRHLVWQMQFLSSPSRHHVFIGDDEFEAERARISNS